MKKVISVLCAMLTFGGISDRARSAFTAVENNILDLVYNKTAYENVRIVIGALRGLEKALDDKKKYFKCVENCLKPIDCYYKGCSKKAVELYEKKILRYEMLDFGELKNCIDGSVNIKYVYDSFDANASDELNNNTNKTKKILARLLAFSDMCSALEGIAKESQGEWMLNRVILKSIAGLSAAAIIVVAIALVAKGIANKMNERERIRRETLKQRLYDKKMLETAGNSSIDVSISRQELIKRFKDIQSERPDFKDMSRLGRQIANFLELGDEAGSLVLFFEGPPGCGKTSLAFRVAEALGVKKPLMYSKNDIDENNKVASVMQQTMGSYNLGGVDRIGKVSAAIKANKHPFIVFDEIDKMPSEMLSCIWNVTDYSRLNNDGGDVKVDRGLFIFTSNTSIEDMFKGKNISMTMESVLSRFGGFIYNISPPGKAGFSASIKGVLSEAAKRTEKKYKVALKWDEGSVEKIVNLYYAHKQSDGMRWLKNFSINLAGIIADACSSIEQKGKILNLTFSDINKKIKVAFPDVGLDTENKIPNAGKTQIVKKVKANPKKYNKKFKNLGNRKVIK